MTARHWIAAAALAAGAAVTTSSLTPAAQASSPSSAESQDTSSLDDQVELAVTVYNSDLALVRDVRNIRLPRGTFDLRFMDIAATVNPATVHFRSLTEPGTRGRARAELRVRPARARQAPAQVRRPRRHAGAAAAGGRHHARGRSQGAGSSATTPRRSGRSANEIVTGLHADHIRSRSCPATSTRGRRSSGRSRTTAPRGIASRRRIWRASCRGTPTTC